MAFDPKHPVALSARENRRRLPIDGIDRDAYERETLERVKAHLAREDTRQWLADTGRTVLDVEVSGTGDEREIGITIDETAGGPQQHRYRLRIWAADWVTEMSGRPERYPPIWLAEHAFDGNRVPARYGGHRHRFDVPVAEIDDPGAYERDVMDAVRWILTGEWERIRAYEQDIELLGMELSGSAPTTELLVSFRGPHGQTGNTIALEIWAEEWVTTKSDGTRVRPTPHQLGSEVVRVLLNED